MTLQPLTDGVWVYAAPVRFLGLRLTATMTVLQLNDGALLIHSPVALEPELKRAVDGLGQVEHLYAPNTFHHLRMGEWARSYPLARLHAPRGLAPKRPDLRIDRFHGEPPDPSFAGLVDEFPINGFRLEEAVLYHRPSHTLVVADLVHNIGRPTHPWTQLYSRLAGFYDQIGLSRVIRFTAFPDKAAARASLDAVLRLPVRRLVVGHGLPVVENPGEALREAYSWLISTTGSGAPLQRRPLKGGCG